MNEQELTVLLAGFRRRLLFASVIRWVLVAGLLASLLGIGAFGREYAARVASLSLVMVLAGWLLMVMVSIRTARNAQVGAALLLGGQLGEAEQELLRAIRGTSVFRGVLLSAVQHYAMLLHARRMYAEAARVFRALLRYGRSQMGSLKKFQTSIRLMLADCELSQGNMQAAYDAFAPVFGTPLTLSERLMLLPVELRYELATGHTANAGAHLREKVRHAELLESPQAAWVHTLLAEACRREGMYIQADFLHQRAVLYHEQGDLPSSLTVDLMNLASGAGA